MFLHPWCAVNCVHAVWTGCALALISVVTDKISALKKVGITCFNNQFGISGLLETWITPDKLCGAISCLFKSSYLLQNAVKLFFAVKFQNCFMESKTLPDSSSRLGLCRSWLNLFFDLSGTCSLTYFIVFSQTILWYLVMATKLDVFQDCVSALAPLGWV